MPLNMARGMVKRFHELAVWFEREASDLDAGQCCRSRNGKDKSAAAAAEFRHRARNLEAIVMAFERVDAAKTEFSEMGLEQSAISDARHCLSTRAM